MYENWVPNFTIGNYVQLSDPTQLEEAISLLQEQADLEIAKRVAQGATPIGKVKIITGTNAYDPLALNVGWKQEFKIWNRFLQA